MRPAIRLATLTLCALTGCKEANRETAENPVTWSAPTISGQLRAGTSSTVHLLAAIDTGWYIYSLTQKPGGPTPMSVTVAPSPPFHIDGGIKGPTPVIVFDKEFGIETERYEGTPAFDLPVAVASDAGVRPVALEVKVRFQACNANFCLPARTVTLTAPARIADRP
jgi:DsbC/DsbD-like thiol-disulfide interchange protein